MYIIILSLLLLVGCHEQQPLFPKPPGNTEKKDTVFELIWETRMDSNRSGVITSNFMQVWKDYFVTTGDIEDPLLIRVFNKYNGKKEWEFVNQNGLKYNIIYNALKEDIYIGITGDGIFGFDLNKREMKWQINQNQLNLRFGWNMTIHGDYIYMPATWMFGKVNISDERMIRIHYLTGEMETVYHIQSVDSLMDAFSSPVFWTDPETGHEIMFFNNQNWNYFLTPQEVSQDLYAVDIETNEVLWCNAEFTPVASNGTIHPIVYNDNIITGGDWSIYSFDAKTGNLNWKREFSQPTPWSLWSTTEHLIKENRLYVNEVGADIACLDADTGEVIWHNTKDASNCTPTMTYYKDMLVYTSWGKGSIMVLDAFTGERIHKERSHNHSTFNTDVVYDEETDMFFTTDYKYAYGFKIHKPE